MKNENTPSNGDSSLFIVKYYPLYFYINVQLQSVE